MAIFTLTVNTRTAGMGDNASQERNAIAQLLTVAAQRIGGHTAPFGGQNVAEPGGVAPTNCSYTFGAGSLNQGL
jgi:hypothetical protein